MSHPQQDFSEVTWLPDGQVQALSLWYESDAWGMLLKESLTVYASGRTSAMHA